MGTARENLAWDAWHSEWSAMRRAEDAIAASRAAGGAEVLVRGGGFVASVLASWASSWSEIDGVCLASGADWAVRLEVICVTRRIE